MLYALGGADDQITLHAIGPAVWGWTVPALPDWRCSSSPCATSPRGSDHGSCSSEHEQVLAAEAFLWLLTLARGGGRRGGAAVVPRSSADHSS